MLSSQAVVKRLNRAGADAVLGRADQAAVPPVHPTGAPTSNLQEGVPK